MPLKKFDHFKGHKTGKVICGINLKNAFFLNKRNITFYGLLKKNKIKLEFPI